MEIEWKYGLIIKVDQCPVSDDRFSEIGDLRLEIKD